MRNVAQKMLNTFIFRAAASHFVNGLIPVAIIFMLLTLDTTDTYFEHTVIHLICVAPMTIPVYFVSGIRGWNARLCGSCHFMTMPVIVLLGISEESRHMLRDREA